MKKFIRTLLLASLLFSPFAFSAPTPQTGQEISYLLSYLKNSGCQFNRNGSWYTSAAAVDHLNQKYQYLLKKGLVSSTEDFISRAATESSFTGTAYQVKCGAAANVASGPWLTTELTRFRAAGKKAGQ